jgi:DNA invertase Pin-like site-specific DNA recombinase
MYFELKPIKEIFMSKVIAYLRVSTDQQDLNNQKLEIYEYERCNKIKVDEFVQITISSRKSSLERKIDYVTEKLNKGDTLIVTELSRLGRSTAAVITMVNELIKREIKLIVIKQNLNLVKHDMSSKIIVTMFSLFAELERDLISMRTKDGLASRKAMGIKLGKPVGTMQKSKFDQDIDKIKEFLKMGLSTRKIAAFFNYPNPIGLNNYIKRKKLRITV